MAIIVSIRAPDAESVARQLATLRASADPVEIRGDDMTADAWCEAIARCPRPVIATIKTLAAGGGFGGSEAERRRRLLLALDAGAAWIDVELDGALSDLASGRQAGRVLLSQHDVDCTVASLGQVLERMQQSDAERFKIVAHANRPSELLEIRRLLGRHEGRALAAFAAGPAGVLSRILATCWGSWATYAFPPGALPTGAAQLSADLLSDGYDVERIGRRTRCVALVGSRVLGSPSPAMHNACMRESDLDMRYLPFQTDSLDDCLPWIEDGALRGLAVTMPFKEEAAQRCTSLDRIASASGAVNTILIDGDGWHGFNTDGPAAVRLLQEKLELRDTSAAIVGAGGTARAVAAALLEAGCRVTLFNRGAERRLQAAARLGCESLDLDRLPDSDARILVQATPLGSDGESIPGAGSLAAEVVLDAVYGEATPLLSSARARGATVIDGGALLVEQALEQYRHLTGRDACRETMSRLCGAWLTQQRSTPSS